MGSVRDVTVANHLVEIQFDLRDKLTASRFETGELLAYLNRCYEMIYMVLVDMNSELVASGTGTITLADGTAEYALGSNAMGDFWLPYRLNKQNQQGQNLYAVYLTDSSSGVHDALPMVSYEDHMDDLLSGTSGEAQPQGFYLFGTSIGFSPVPDAAYTCTVLKYFPNFAVLSTNMPLNNLFNQAMNFGVQMFANNRNDKSTLAVETQLMDYFTERAMKIMGKRHRQPSSFSPRWR